MGKHPKIEMVKLTMKVPRGHDGFWSLICEFDICGPWDLKMIDDRCNVDVTTIRDFVRRLVRGGFAEKVGTRPVSGNSTTEADLYRLVKRPFETPRLDRNGKVLPESRRETLWRAMKMLKDFDAAELSRETSTPERVITHQHTYKYLLALSAVGIIAPIDPTRSARSARYRLVRNLGAKAPSISKAEVVFDPNSRTIIGEPVLEVSP